MVKSSLEMVADAKRRIRNLSNDQLADAMAAGDVTVVDIRDVRERVLQGAIPGSLHAPRGMLEFWIDPDSGYHRREFDPANHYILYCAAGARSALATDLMQDMGYTNVAHLEFGFGGWKADEREIEDVASTSKWVRRDA